MYIEDQDLILSIKEFGYANESMDYHDIMAWVRIRFIEFKPFILSETKTMVKNNSFDDSAKLLLLKKILNKANKIKTN